MSTAVFRQLGALLPPIHDPLLFVCPLRTSTLATLATFLPLPHTQPPVPLPKPPSASYSHAVAPGPQAVDLRAQLSAFRTEFKTLFSQLMQQTSTILTMLTAILPCLTA